MHPSNRQGEADASERLPYALGIAELEAVAGRSAALSIIAACAGRSILVRAEPSHEDELTRVVGPDAAQAIADELLGDDEESRHFFINQPTYCVTAPGEKVAPVLDAIAPRSEEVLSGTLGKIEKLCGRDAALKIAAHYGGRRVYLPFEVTAKSTIAKVIGFEAAQTLADEWDGGSLINIPSAAYGSTAVRRDLGMKMLRDGYRPADVVRLLKVSRTQVFEWSKKIKEEQK